MKAFILLILSAYLALWHEMSRIKWQATRKNDEVNLKYPSLQKMVL